MEIPIDWVTDFSNSKAAKMHAMVSNIADDLLDELIESVAFREEIMGKEYAGQYALRQLSHIRKLREIAAQLDQ